MLASLNIHVFPVIGHLSVSGLKPRHFIYLLEGIEEKGLLEVASRTWTTTLFIRAKKREHG